MKFFHKLKKKILGSLRDFVTYSSIGFATVNTLLLFSFSEWLNSIIFIIKFYNCVGFICTEGLVIGQYWWFSYECKLTPCIDLFCILLSSHYSDSNQPRQPVPQIINTYIHVPLNIPSHIYMCTTNIWMR